MFKYDPIVPIDNHAVIERKAIDPTRLISDISAENEGTDLDQLFESVDEEFLSGISAEEVFETVQNMLHDEQVSAEMETFKSFVTRTQYVIEGEDDNLVQFYKDIIARDGGALIKQTNEFLNALDYGRVICELIWADPAITGGWYVDRLKPLSHTRYGFNQRGRMVDVANNVILDDEPYKYVSVSHNVIAGNLNGKSMELGVYWAWFFRKACIKAGLLYVKKAIIPSIIAMYKASANKEATQAEGLLLAAELKKLANNSGIAVANVDKIESINASAKGDDVINLVEMFNRMISKGILGSSTLTNDTRYSNRGDTKNQEALVEARAEKVTTRELQPAINTILRWTAELNIGKIDPEKLPLFKFIYEYDPTFEETIKAVQAQVPVSAKWFHSKYNVVRAEDDDDLLVEPTSIPTVPTELSSFFLQTERRRNALKVRSQTLPLLPKSTDDK